MFDLLAFILTIRHDLREGLGFGLKKNLLLYLEWLMQTGVKEYQAVAEDAGLRDLLATSGLGPIQSLTLLQNLVRKRRLDVQAEFPLPASQQHFIDWFYTHGVEECDIWSYLSKAEQQRVLALSEPWPARLAPIIANASVPLRRPMPARGHKFGVNVIGYAFGQLGIGEDMRMAALALKAAKVPMAMLNFPPGPDIPQEDRSMAAHVKSRGDFFINLFCVTAEETGRYFAEKGNAQFKTRYTIGYWPWELTKWPRDWEMVLPLVDEVWVSSQHTYDALAPVCDKPLQIMPMTVDLGEVRSFASRAQARNYFGLPAKATLFCFAFDLKSHMARKNPQACVEAFLTAFPRRQTEQDSDVGLVIKVNKPTKPDQAWTRLKAQAAKDPRIHIIEGTLQRPQLLALYQACDCYLSLHRAEGFGRGIAEALQLGLHVICTGYSGNVDFCQPPLADLVRYQLVKVHKSQYVHTQGQMWAEPDVKHAAQLMKRFVQHPVKRRKRHWPQFSAVVVGKRYRTRLEAIMKLAPFVSDAD